MNDTEQSTGVNAQLEKGRRALNPVPPIISAVLVLIAFLIYLPTLAAKPLYDEWYLFAWLKHVLKVGNCFNWAFLSFVGFDPRDGYLPLGVLSLITQLSGHFLSVAVHAMNSVLVFLTALNLNNGSEANSNLAHSNIASTATAANKDSIAPNCQIHPGHLTVAALAGLMMAVSPLAPEAVSWAGGFPQELATTMVMGAFMLRSKLLAAIVLTALAPFFSVRVVPLLLIAGTASLMRRRGKSRNALIFAAATLISSAIAVTVYNAEASSCALPPKLAALKVPQLNKEESDLFEGSPAANAVAMMLPVNKSINNNYNKLFRPLYTMLPIIGVLSLAALITPWFRNRFLPTLLLFSLGSICGAFLSGGTNLAVIDRQNFYGCRWFYPLLPIWTYLSALALACPFFIVGNKKIAAINWLDTTVRLTATLILTFVVGTFLIPRTYTQIASLRSNSKLWTTVQESIQISAAKAAGPYVLVRDLPESLSVAPILSPFDPLLIDGTSKLSRASFVSSGRLIDSLRKGEERNICLAFDKNLGGLVQCEFEASTAPFGPELKATAIADHLAPPLAFYNGAIKLDAAQENLLLESNSKAGPACRITSDGLSPISHDFLCVEAKIDTPQVNPGPMELHWVTNRKPDWEPRERRVLVDAIVGDGQYHRYYFPLRSTNFALNGFPTYLMIGFPGGSRVALRSIALVDEALPKLEAAPETNTEANFAAFTSAYPSNEKLGLVAVVGADNKLILKWEEAAVKIELGQANSRFSSENAEHPESGSTVIERSGSGTVLSLKDLSPQARIAWGSIVPIRIFSNKYPHASDTIFVLFAPSSK